MLARSSGECAEHDLRFQATSPCCPAEVVGDAIAEYHSSQANSLRSVTAVKHHPEWMGSIDAHGDFHFLTAPAARASRRQDLQPVYRLNGAINIFHAQSVVDRQFDDAPHAFVMSEEDSIDIDTPSDWERAEAELDRRVDEGSLLHVSSTDRGA